MSFKLADGSVGTLIYTASGDKAFSREMTEIFFDGKTISSKDFRVSELHATGKATTFKTNGQEMGYKQELENFTACVNGGLQPTVTFAQSLDTMAVIFAIERALATASVETLTVAGHYEQKMPI
jgi:predicted dehydrogenase